MPTIEKRGKRWRARVRKDGASLSKTFHTKAEAMGWAGDTERKVIAHNLPGAHGKTLRDVFDRYAAEVSPSKPSGKHEATRLAYLARQPIAAKRLDELTPDDLGRFRDERLKTNAASSLLRDFALISHCLKVAVREWRWLSENPLAPVRRPKDGPPRQRRVLDGEIEALRIASGYRPATRPETASARVIAAFELGCETALRGGEICALRREHCHTGHVHVAASKNGEARDVPLTLRAREILRQLLSVQLNPVFGLDVHQKDALFRKMRRRAGIAGLNFHDSRREGCTRMARLFDVLELSRITGHRDLGILRDVYYRPTIDELAAKLKGTK